MTAVGDISRHDCLCHVQITIPQERGGSESPALILMRVKYNAEHGSVEAWKIKPLSTDSF